MHGDDLFVHVRLDPVSVVVPAASVQCIAAREDAPGGEGLTDLARLLGVAAPNAARRALEIEADGARAWVVVGDQVAIQRVPRDALADLPQWLCALSERLPLEGLVRLERRFAFVLDVRRLLRSGP